ncbi:MAG: hypothetical protein ACT4P3_00885 [Betaproteobacteria bacterium]
MLIAISAWPHESTKLRAGMTGFDRFLAKPAEPGEVLDLLKKL